MKFISALLLLGVFAGCLTKSITSSPGCMDNSHHAARCVDGPEICCSIDYKMLHAVSCYCPCDRYPQLEKGRCARCRHFRVPTEYS